MIIECLLLFTGLSLAEDGHLAPQYYKPVATQTQTPKNSVSLIKKLRTFGGEPVVDDPAGDAGFPFLPPNEYHGDLFESVLNKPAGALISVGTFRGLNNASAGNVSHLVLLDYSSGITQFNLVNCQLLAMAKDRFEYLSMLVLGERSNPYLAEARAGKISIQQYVEKMIASFQSDEIHAALSSPDVSRVPYRIADKWRRLGVELESEEGWKILNHVSKEDPLLEYYLWNDRKLLGSLKDYDQHGSGIGKTIFGDDSRFKLAQSMIRDGKVSVVLGDLTGNQALAQLARVAREKSISVSAVDASNVPSGFLESLDGWNKMTGNLKRFPYSSSGRILFTHHNNPFSDDGYLSSRQKYGISARPELNQFQGTSWYYYATKASDLNRLDADFKKAAATGRTESYAAFPFLLEKWMAPDPSQKQTPPLLFTPLEAAAPHK